MLSQLYIENIAVIQMATIDFTHGLNVFTGETGAGKTILISAINAVLGGRVSKDIIRSGESKAVVIATFCDLPSALEQQIEHLGYTLDEGQLLISREISLDGKSSVRINGRPSTVSVLKEVAELLIDIHGQHDSRDLLNAERHLSFIDGFGELFNEIEQYSHVYGELCSVRTRLAATQMDESLKLQRQDILQYQIDEIAAADLVEGEEEELLSQRDIIRNAEKITDALSLIYNLLNGGEDTAGMLSEVVDLDDSLQTAAEYIDEFANYSSKISELVYELQELSGAARNYLDDSGFDPRQLDAIEERLDLINKLERKYGETISDVLEYYNKIIEEMDSLIFSDKEAEKLRAEEAKLLTNAQSLADALTTRRRQAANDFLELIGQELVYLDMPNVRLTLKMDKKSLCANGQDVAELLISANIGEVPKPLSKIASGGELSRIMLAIKNVLADKDDIGTIIFDEIDTGVSGRAAYKIGKKLSEVAASRQVICVTHLAQVAAFGNTHLKIYKQVENGRTFTHVAKLARPERIQELARITVGENLTRASLASAEEMLQQAGN